MNWKETSIDIGTVREKSKSTFTYELISDLEIASLSVGCAGCTKAKVVKEGVEVTYTANPVPIHIARMVGFEFQGIRKTVTVTFKDGSKDVLTFRGKVIKK